VRRERSETDRRAYAVSLTELGRERLTEAARIATGVMGDLLESFDATEERQLNAMLQRIIDRARQLRQG
jgi:DNA-binding MarR family transcriptional regulator